jgi:hypothetical protein
MNAEIIIGLALMGIGAAVVAFLRTPAEFRYKQQEPTKEAGAEYAEQYSRTERVRFILIGLAINGSLYLGWKFWALPRWADFAKMSPCYEFWGINGVTILFYALFVGIPLLSALGVAFLISRRGLKILHDGRLPYRGEKVFRLTRIKRGRTALLAGWLHVLSPLPLVAVAVWGAHQAEALSSGITGKNFDYSQCGAKAGGNDGQAAR